MSTKTTFKRVALVTVAALGLSGLTVLAAPSASAAEATTAKVTAVTVAAVGTGRVGSVFTSQVGFTTASSIAGDSFTFRARFDEKPATSTAVVGFNATGLDIATTSDEAGTATAAGASGNELLPAKLAITAATGAPGAQTAVAGRVGFVPDVTGSYVVTVWHDADGDGLIGTAEAKATRTFTVGSAVASVKVTSLTGTALATANTGNGALVKLELLDAAGAAAGLASNEAIRLSPSTSTMDITLANGVAVAHTAGASSYVDLVAANFTKGVSYVNLTDSAAATATVSIAGQGGSVTGVIGTFTQKFVASDVSGNTVTTILTTGATTAAAYGTGSTIGVAGAIAGITIPNGSKTLTYLSTLTAGVATTTTDAYLSATITDNSGYVTGAAVQGITTDLVQDKALLLTESTTTAGTFTTSVSVTTTAPAAEQQFVIVIAEGDAGDTTSTVTSTATVTTSSGLVSVSPSTALALKIAGSVTYNVTVKDNFGRVLPNASVKMVITGRNANQTVTPPTATTSSTGVASFTLTDAPAAGTTALTDSIVFTAVGYDGSSKDSTAVTITWSATGPVVSTVTILGGNNATTTGVADTAPTYLDIAAGTAGASGTTATAVATVKDSAGNLLAGVPVTFTISGTTAAVLSTTQTVYTSATGTATGNVYAWVAGSYTVTATAGTATGTAVYAFRQAAAGEERAISATVSGNMVTAKVVDRFGNPVPLVTVYATKSGIGYFGNGTLKTTAVTDNAGEASFIIAGGDADVTVATYDIATAVAPLGSGQTCAAAGKSDCADPATSFTASAAGTTTTAEKGVGASFSAAGVAKATVSVTGDNSAQAAADAAAEATDAANAATDAANAAAEAADAATAAAQDAADAVAALSTQVSEMVNALKKQITALTNLVIKIQKKVKA